MLQDLYRGTPAPYRRVELPHPQLLPYAPCCSPSYGAPCIKANMVVHRRGGQQGGGSRKGTKETGMREKGTR